MFYLIKDARPPCKVKKSFYNYRNNIKFFTKIGDKIGNLDSVTLLLLDKANIDVVHFWFEFDVSKK